MRLFKILFVIIAVTTAAVVYKASAADSEKSKLDDMILYDDVEITAQFVEVLGKRTTKFQEYREVVSGPQAQKEIFMIGSPNSSVYTYFEGFNLFRRDQSVFVEVGEVGKYKVNFEFNQTPHRYSRDARTIEQDYSTGNYVVDPGTRTLLQGLGAAAQAAQINQLVPDFTKRSLEVNRDRYDWNISSWLSDTIQMEVKSGFETREGLRRKGTGTYMRTNDSFTGRGIELPEPVEYETLDFGARLTYAVPKSVTSLDWAFSYFNNRVDALIWDNPFRITDMAATGATGTANRGNFARGRVSLYPDNIANTVTLSQALTLPYETNFTGSISYGIYLQNDSFLPYTTNSAIEALSGFPVTDTTRLPNSSLDGMAHVISPNFTIINRAIDNLKVKLYMNMYSYIDNSRKITFPGYAAFGDSFWLTNITNDTITNHAPSFTDVKTGLKLDYELTKKVSLNSEYQYAFRDLANRQVSGTGENMFKNGIEIRPWNTVKIEGFYTYSWRDYFGNYYYHRENSRLRMFDQVAKNRNQIDGRVEITPNQQVTLGASGMWSRDNYRTNYGLTRREALNISVDGEYAPSETWSLYSYYSMDQDKFNITSIAKSGVPYDTSNTWFSNTTVNTNSLGTGLKCSLIPERLGLDLGYAFSLALQKIDNSNYSANPANPVSATAWEWPVVRNDYQEVKLKLNYKIHKNWEIKGYYGVEIYNLNDFAWDDLRPYMQGQMAATSGDDSTQYLWLDSRYSDYTAHVFGVTLRYVF